MLHFRELLHSVRRDLFDQQEFRPTTRTLQLVPREGCFRLRRRVLHRCVSDAGVTISYPEIELTFRLATTSSPSTSCRSC